MLPVLSGPARYSRDRYFGSVGFLAHFDGTNGSTTITTVVNAVNATAFGNAQLSTSSPKFGSASLLLDGAGDYIDIRNCFAGVSGAGDFTLEFWAKFASLAATLRLYDQYRGASTEHQLGVLITSTNIQVVINGSTILDAAHGMSTGTYYFITVERYNGTIKAFVNTTQKASASNSTSVNSAPSIITLGINGADGTSEPMNGNIDDTRITNAGRYRGAVSAVPTAAFPDGF